jgi:hypothetical protein
MYMKLKYYINNTILSLIILTIFFSINTTAETVIYDNLTTSNYKVVQITDDLNYKFITDYSYDVYIDGNFLGSYKKDEKIFVPDNSVILIYVPSPIKTDLNDYWSLIKSNGIIIISFLLTFVIVLAIIIKVYKHLR